MARLVREHDWESTLLGPVNGWSPSLRLITDTILASGFPLALRWGPDFVLIYNDGYKPILGDKHPAALGVPFRDAWPEVQARLAPLHAAIIEGTSPGFFTEDLSLRIQRRAGRWEDAHFAVSYSPVPDATCRTGIGGVLIAAIETTQRLKTEATLRETEKALLVANAELRLERRTVSRDNQRLSAETENLRRLFEQAPGFIAVLTGKDHRFQLCNPAYSRLIGNREVIGKPVREALPEIDGQGFIGLLDQVYQSGEPFVGQNVRTLIRDHDGRTEEHILDFVYQPITDRNGAVIGVFVEGHDVTSLARAQAGLLESEERFRLVAENAPVMIWMGDETGRCVYLNQAQREFWGLRPEDVSSFQWGTTLHPDDQPTLYVPFSKAMQEHSGFTVEARYWRKDKELRLLRTDGRPRFGANGQFLGMIGVNVDITESRKAELALHDMNATLEQQVQQRTEQLRAQEEQLRQAQKMEAVGQLTGGVAHDFNNLLQIILGNLETLQRNIPSDAGGIRRAVENAMSGARRAANLTAHLLAFSRRQPLEPKPIKINELVTDMSELFHRSLGETISVETVLAAGLWRAEADPNQLESALLNLALNARDAMPDGGKLTIETANAFIDENYAATHVEVAAGQYVVVSISDTGSGMSKRTLEQAFEPFFTTKEPGKGTGLGLSQIYGFAKQSNGHVKLYSEEGHGTTVKLYLPRIRDENIEPESPVENIELKESAGETILLVEDDHAVRAYSADVLRELGYQVIEASDGPSAIRILKSDTRIDMLFTDVVLPNGLTGAQIASQAQSIRPTIKVLFTTGYARNAIVHHGRLDAGVQLITKPFTYAQLAGKVRMILDGAG
jgi:PAS domain S-box-containing protein